MFTGGSPTAPSAGADSAVGSSAANSSMDYSQTTDDQILDSGADDGAGGESDGAGAQDQAGQGDEFEVVDLNDEAADGGEGEGQGEGEGEQAEAQEGEDDQQQTEDEIPTDQTADPAALRQVFKNHPELRNAFYSERAFREVIPTVAEARQYKEALPTLDDVQTAVQARDDLAQLDELFYSDDPAGTRGFIERLAQTDEGAFGRLAASFPTTLYELNPDAYRQHIATPAVTASLNNLMQLALSRGEGGTNLKNAVDVIAMNLFGKRFDQVREQGTASAKSPREVQLERQLQQQTQERETQQFQSFHATANETAVNGVIGAIKSTLLGDSKAKIAGILKGSALEGNEKAVNKIVGEVYNAIDATLKANKPLTQQLRNEFKAAKAAGYSKEAQQKIASLLLQRAKLLIPAAAKKVVGEYTELAVGNNRQRLTSMRQAASRVDVTGSAGGGAPKGGARPKVTAQSIDYRRTSDDDIMDGKVTVRKGR